MSEPLDEWQQYERECTLAFLRNRLDEHQAGPQAGGFWRDTFLRIAFRDYWTRRHAAYSAYADAINQIEMGVHVLAEEKRRERENYWRHICAPDAGVPDEGGEE